MAKVYIESTIPSYLAARPSRDLLVAAHQQVTRNWWEWRRSRFELYSSELVLEEIRTGDVSLAKRRLDFLADIPLLALNDEILNLAESLVTDGLIPRKAAADAAHIATATVYGCEYLLTWNCRHIANAELQRAMAPIVKRKGYELPSLCTPEELMGSER